MENCLVTKLKSVVDNNNLNELGTIKLPVLNTNGSKKVFVRLGGYDQDHPVSVTIGDGTLYLYGSSTPYPVPAELYGTGAREYIANSDTTLRIANKYNLAAIDLSKYGYDNQTGDYVFKNIFPENYIIDNDEYKYCQHLVYLVEVTDIIRGRLEDSFSKLISVPSTFKILVKEGQGDIAELVRRWVSNGLTSGQIDNFQIAKILDTVYGGYDILFNGHIINMALVGTLVWNNTKIYTTWGSEVLCVGYTDEEISTNTASGGIWEGKTVTKCG